MIKIKRFSTLDKLTLLLATFVMGFTFVLFVGYDNTTKMKRSIDLIYFGSYVQVVKLKNISTIINEDIIKETINYQNRNLTTDNSIKNIKDLQTQIANNWKYYKNSYKTDKELKNVKLVDSLIQNTILYFEDIKIAISNNKKVSLNRIIHRLEPMAKALEKTINYETDNAYIQKTLINENYSYTLMILGVILFFMAISIATISYFIVKSIKKNEDSLINMAKELRDLSITDPLTKLYNRRHFTDIFHQEARKCQRERKHLTFMMIDIDYFKKYNDTYGHGMGDDVLKDVANCFKTNLRRPCDFVFRLGGEEFGILISGEDSSNASLMADYVVEKVRDLKIPHKASEVSKNVSISLGYLSFIPDNTTNLDRTMEKADEYLYQTKESGRNGVKGRVL
ncbi:MAG: diguanylate cyclase [Campylobacterales bacterium]|nr:diguanylate cyclase [Campylobacterales bacterium]